MKVIMLCPLLSSSSMITVYPAAMALSKRHGVRLVGPLLGRKPFISGSGIRTDVVEPPLKSPAQLAMLELYWKNRSVLMSEKFDVVHAFKLLPHTAPAAAAAKRRTGCRFVLSIDDYDVSSSRNPAKRIVMKWAERSAKSADAVIVSSSYLQKIYGGEIIYQVPDERLFLSKAKTRPDAVKRRLGIEGKTMVLYAGTFYRHKGIDVLIRAVQRLGRDDIRLVLAGGGADEARLRKIAGPETIFAGSLPMEGAAELTAACDIYAIPTTDCEYARAEIPGKIFEPMMLGKPVVASRISDIPLILGGAGIIAEPGNTVSLSKSIEHLADNPTAAKKLGAAAKKRYLANYSMRHFEAKISKIYRGLEK
jgi:glycosyltransferase involved in cell wall biosynthesis